MEDMLVVCSVVISCAVFPACERLYGVLECWRRARCGNREKKNCGYSRSTGLVLVR